MSNSRLTTKPSKPPAAAISAGHQVVAHKSTGGMLTSFPQPVDPVGNASDRLTNNTVALPPGRGGHMAERRVVGPPQPVMDLLQQLELSGLLDRALAEDIGLGDVTTAATVKPDARGRARITVKEDADRLLRRTADRADPGALRRAGANREAGRRRARCCIVAHVAAEIEGLLAGLLIGERTALNFLQLMSGIATRTGAISYARSRARRRAIVDTRKTHPGLRAVEKYAVHVGGGFNHRFGLDSGVLIKDNHIAAAGSVSTAVELARQTSPHTLKLEIECETLAQLEEAIAAARRYRPAR